MIRTVNQLPNMLNKVIYGALTFLTDSSSKSRSAHIVRNTRETSLTVDAQIDGNGNFQVTNLNFLDHLISTIGRHSMIDLALTAQSNDHILHHVIEDTAIALCSS